MRLKERIEEAEFRIFVLETAVRVLAQSLDAQRLFAGREFEAELSAELRAAYGAELGAAADPEAVSAAVEETIGGLKALLAPDAAAPGEDDRR